MAKQSGIIKLEGTFGDIAFYKSQDGHLARAKGGISADRIKGDAAFQRTRENMDEFGRAGLPENFYEWLSGLTFRITPITGW